MVSRYKRPRRHLQFEPLERREVMTSGVTAGFAGGILTVTGTDNADAITLFRNGQWIGIAGTTYGFDHSQVSGIVINPKGGNDSVSLDSVALGFSSLDENVTVNAGPGTETVRLPSGQTVTMTGVGNTVYVASTGQAWLNGIAVELAPPPPPSTVTAALKNGVLTINGTNNADSIRLFQNGQWIGIAGTNYGFDHTKVNSIVINLNGGDDYASLDGVALGFTSIAEHVTIKSGAGNESVRLASGNTVTMTGNGHTLVVTAAGAATLDGAALNLPSATLTAILNGGVLTVNATNGADDIKFFQNDVYIGIYGTNNGWHRDQVNEIVVYLHGGNDLADFDSVGRGWAALSEKIVVRSGDGTETVKLAGGQLVSMSGVGHKVDISAAGQAWLDGVLVTPTPPPPPPPPAPGPWFDANIVDAALRTLANARYGDGSLSRADMIELLRDAKDGDVVDATELSDLRKIVANTTLFAGLEHVWKLGSYVVTASVANTSYQGAALGNLAAGSNGAHLDKLVNKWFLGLDRPTTGYVYQQFAGQLFVNGATYQDVKQGAVGDCYFVATLAEVALKNPSAITNMFIVNGDGTYTVRFFNGSTTHYVTVDSYLPTYGGGGAAYAGQGLNYTNTSGELWVSLAEKAYVQANEFGFIRSGLSGSGINSYDAISGGYINYAIRHVTGLSTVNYAYTSGGTSFNTFVTAYNANKMIAFASMTTPASGSVVGSHAYAVVGYDAGTQKVTLFNPWGISYGLLTLSWAEIQANFTYFDRTA
jgi:hypothetical protein